MPSDVAYSMMRKHRMRMPTKMRGMSDYGGKESGDDYGKHEDADQYQHQHLDRQHAYDEAMEALSSLAKDGMPGAEELHKMLETHWSQWVGKEKPMHPEPKSSHKASYVSKSPMDEQDEEMYKSDKYDASKE